MRRTLHLSLFLLLWSLPLSAQQLRIYHIDVEQASATLFVAPGGKTLLVDSGKNGMGQRIKTVMNRASVTTIDYFVDTHYHEDHYGGIDDLVELGVAVGEAYDRGGKNQLSADKLSEDTFKDYQAAIGYRAQALTRGMTLPIDPLMKVTCISSGGIVIGEDPPIVNNDENNLSISLLITLGTFRYFIGGDIQSPTEQKIADRDLVKDVDVYVADHHGSETSSIASFLLDMSPHVVIISNGDNASFHHPRQAVLTSIGQLPGPPTVFQTNKCTKGPPCGNVPDEYIGDPQSTGQDGTIALTADLATHSYTVSFDSGVSRIFPFRISQFLLSVNKTGTGSGTVTSSPAAVLCGDGGVACNVNFAYGQVVALFATPSMGSVFTGWTGDPDCSDGNVTTFAERSCLAAFTMMPPNSWTLISGGFENGVVPAWTEFGNGTTSISALARTGASSLAEIGLGGGVYQDLTGLTPGALYQVTAYSRSAPGSTAQALLWVHDTSRSGSNFDGWRSPSSNGWDAFTVTFVATANGRSRIHLISSGESGAIYWDDVRVTDASGFEAGVSAPWSTFGGVNASVTPSVAGTGTFSLVEDGGGGVYQDLTGLTPRAIYRVTALARSTPGATDQALLWVHDSFGSGSVGDGWKTPSSSGWDTFSVTFVATASGRMRIHLMSSGGAGSVYWDDVHVDEASGFEGGFLAPWVPFGNANSSVTAVASNSGTASLSESGGPGGVYQDLTGLTSGTIYQVTVSVRSTPGTTGQTVLWVHDAVGGGGVVDGWRTPSSNGWEIYTATFMATVSGRMRIHLYYSGGPGIVYWDDVHVADASGFEDGVLAPWSPFGSVNASLTTSQSNVGTSSLAESGGNGGVYLDIAGLIPGTLYQVTAYAHSSPGTTGQALLWVHDSTGVGSVFDGWMTPSSSGWESYTVTFVATANGRMRIHLISNGGAGTVYWDEVKVN